MADQAVSSVTNLVVSLLAARALDPDDFGAFALAMSFYFMAAAAIRSVVGDVLVVRYSHADDTAGPEPAADPGSAGLGEADRATARRSSGVAFGAGAVGSAVALLSALVVGGPVVGVLVALAVLLPLLMVQDTVRYLFVARGQPERAFAVDVLWGVLQLAAVLVVLAGQAQAWSVVAAWGGAGAVAGIVGMLWATAVPSPAGVVGWLGEHRDLWPRYLVEYGAGLIAWQVVLVGVGGIAGLAAVGALRAVQVLFGPLHVLNTGARLVAVAEGRRRQGEEAMAARRLVGRVRDLLAGVALVWTGVLFLMPDGVGEALLGENWEGASDVIVPFGIFMATQGVLAAASIGLRVLVAPREALRVALVAAGLLVVPGLAAAFGGGPPAIAWALAAGGTIGSALWWLTYRGVFRAQVALSGGTVHRGRESRRS